MRSGGGGWARLAGLALVTVALAVVQPILLAGIPLVVTLAAFGPRDLRAGFVVAVVLAIALLGRRTSELWWFERGWPLLLGGTFALVAGWRPRWRFIQRALSAVGLAAAVAAAVFGLAPRAWATIDSAMASRAAASAQDVVNLIGDAASERMRGAMMEVAHLQAVLFPALLGIGSLAALGVAAWIRGLLVGEEDAVGPLREFRFNDHLIWLWVIGLILLLAPVGDVGTRLGGNAVLFMGLLYVVRGFAVALTAMGGIPVAAGILGGAVVVIVSPLLAVVLILALLVGLGDTWLDLRARLGASRAGD